MGFWEIIKLFYALLKAPESIRALVLLVSKSNAEKKQELAEQADAMIKQSQEGERPIWEE